MAEGAVDYSVRLLFYAAPRVRGWGEIWMSITASLLLFSIGPRFFFFAAGLFVSFAYLWKQRKLAWLPLALSLFILCSLCGLYIIYRLAAHFPNPLTADTPVIVLFISAGALALLSAFWLSNLARIEQAALLAAQEKASRYRINFEQDPRLLVIKDANGAYLAVNPAYAAFLGKQTQALKNETDFSFFPRSVANSLRQNDEKALASSEPLTMEMELFGVPGARLFQLTRTPLLGAAGEPLGLLFAASDITIEKQRTSQFEAWQRGVAVLLEYGALSFNLEEKYDLLRDLLPWAVRLAETQHVGLWRIQPEAQVAELQYAGRLAAHPGERLRLGDDLPWKVWKNAKPGLLPECPIPQSTAFGRQRPLRSAASARHWFSIRR